jgi:hypothetical protein
LGATSNLKKSRFRTQGSILAPIIETRLIYTAGVFKLSDEIRACRRIILLVDMLRTPPFQVYQSEKSNPPYGFYGYYTVWRGDYVEYRAPLEFTEQVVLGYDNPSYQLTNLVLGAATTVLGTIQALGAAMTPPALIAFFPLPPPTVEVCPFTKIKFKLVFGTRIQVTAVGFPVEEYDGQQAVPDLSYPDDTVPPYPDDRPRGEDPARSPGYEDDLPGDTAPATPDDPDLGLTTDPCEGLGYWLIEGTNDVSGATLTLAIRGSATDSFSFELQPAGECRDGQRQDLFMNGNPAYEYFGCSSRIEGYTFAYEPGSVPPPGYDVLDNLQYPGC